MFNMIESEFYRSRDAGVSSPEIKFGKKLQNRMRSAFDRAGLTIVGGASDGQQTGSRHLLPAFLQADFAVNKDPLEAARVNGALPKVAETLLGSGARHDTYIDRIGGHDLENLSQLVVDLASKGPKEAGIVFRVVYGAAKEMPARALSYPLPALMIMDELKRKGIEPPQLQIIFANHISSSLNGFACEQASEQAHVLADASRAYVERYFPSIAEDVVFLEDKEKEDNENLAGEITNLSTLLEADAGEELIESLQRKGEASDRNTSLQYAAAHLLFHDVAFEGLLQPLILGQPDAVQPQAIINVGGRQEQFFYELRQNMKGKLGDRYATVPTVQLFTKHHVPPYYMAQGGDISLQDALQGVSPDSTDISATAQYDLAFLSKVTQPRQVNAKERIIFI